MAISLSNRARDCSLNNLAAVKQTYASARRETKNNPGNAVDGPNRQVVIGLDRIYFFELDSDQLQLYAPAKMQPSS
jgi:hypothetical protein